MPATPTRPPEILPAQQAEHRRAFTPGRKPPLPVTLGGRSGRPPGSRRRRRSRAAGARGPSHPGVFRLGECPCGSVMRPFERLNQHPTPSISQPQEPSAPRMDATRTREQNVNLGKSVVIAPGRSATSVTAHNDSAWASLTSKQANLWPQEFLKSAPPAGHEASGRKRVPLRVGRVRWAAHPRAEAVSPLVVRPRLGAWPGDVARASLVARLA